MDDLWRRAGPRLRPQRRQPLQPRETAAGGAGVSATWTGSLFLVLSASAYGTVPIFARLFYDAGGTPLAVLAFRYAAGALLLAVALPLMGHRLRLRPAGIVIGGLLAGISYGYLASVRYIPVSAAALILFTYPMLTVLAARLLGLERIGWQRGLGVIAAFVGLAMGLDVDPAVALDWRGVALAAAAALAYTALLLATQRAASAGGGVDLLFQVNLVSAAVFLPIVLLAGEAVPPASPAAWIGLLGVATTFLIGIIAFIAGVSRIGAVRAAALSNLEPLVSISGAVLFLGESLGPVQVAGIALAAAGIFAMSR
jgi:drug/metabolite transporter (DMT)-like permease